MAAVFVGGCLGAILRAGLLEIAPEEPATWPWATFLANMLGTALLAWLMLHLHRDLPVSARRRRLTEPGLCGALTTFAALQLEVLWMLDAGAWGLAIGYVAASLAGGLALAWTGIALTRRYRLEGPAGVDPARPEGGGPSAATDGTTETGGAE